MADGPKLTAKQINDAAASSLKQKPAVTPESESHKIIVTHRSVIKAEPSTAPEVGLPVKAATPKAAAVIEPVKPVAPAPTTVSKKIEPLTPPEPITAEEEAEPEQAEPAADPAINAIVNEEAEASKSSARLTELVENGTYFLPINSREKRRAKRTAIAGTALIVLLGAAWVNIALDAGLIAINGVEPLTHFFSD